MFGRTLFDDSVWKDLNGYKFYCQHGDNIHCKDDFKCDLEGEMINHIRNDHGQDVEDSYVRAVCRRRTDIDYDFELKINARKSKR